MIAPPFAHWLLLVTLGFFPNQIQIPTGGFDPVTGWDHYQIYRRHAACEREAREWYDVYGPGGIAPDPMYSIRCVRYGKRKLDI
jgi:hypothetical protein